MWGHQMMGVVRHTVSRRGFLRLVGLAAGASMGSQLLGAGKMLAAPRRAPPAGKLRHVRTFRTLHGNPAEMAWSPDGKTLYVANGEGLDAALKVDVSDLAKPRITHANGETYFLWAVGYAGNLLVMQDSYAGTIARLNPATLATVRTRESVGPGVSHAIVTDGSRIVVPSVSGPRPSSPAPRGALVILNPNLAEVNRVYAPDPWWDVQEMNWEGGRIYVGVGTDNPAGPQPGGCYIFDARPGRPITYLGKIPGYGWNAAARGKRVWREDFRPDGALIKCWDVSNPASPRLLGSYLMPNAPNPTDPPNPHVANFNRLLVNAAGTRLYATYSRGGIDVEAGIAVFDVAGPNPKLIRTQGWRWPNGRYDDPDYLALSPDEAKLAVSSLKWGVRFIRVVGDALTEISFLPTAGEARDVYVTPKRLHVFAYYTFQSFDRQTGERLSVWVPGDVIKNSWRPFKDGTIIIPQNYAAGMLVFRPGDELNLIGHLDWHPFPACNDLCFIHPDLVCAAANGVFFIGRVGTFDATAKLYPFTELASVTPPFAPKPRRDDAAILDAVLQVGSEVWALGPDVGIVVYDVANPAAPRLVKHIPFTYEFYGPNNLIAARGHVYAACGHEGVMIFDAARKQRVGIIPGPTANFVDVLGDKLLVANYWNPKDYKEGLLVFNLRPNPAAPAFWAEYPAVTDHNFRVRAFGADRIFRIPLYGVNELQVAT